MQSFDIGQRRVAGAKIIQGETHTKLIQLSHAPGHMLDILDQQALGNLQQQASRRHRMDLQTTLHPVHEIRLMELPRADVDRQAQGRQQGVVAPALQQLTGTLQNLLPQGHNEAGRFGQWDEFRRRDPAQVLVFPAQQDLQSGNTIILLHLWLQVNFQGFAFNRLPQGAFQAQTVVHTLLHLRVEKAHFASAPGAGFGQSQIGIAQHGLQIPVQIGKHGDTNIGPHTLHGTGKPIRLREGLHQQAGATPRLHDGGFPVRAEVFEQNHEVIRTQSRGEVGLRKTALNPRSRQPQNLVPRGVPLTVIDQAEFTQVESQQGSLETGARVASNGVIERLKQL